MARQWSSTVRVARPRVSRSKLGFQALTRWRGMRRVEASWMAQRSAGPLVGAVDADHDGWVAAGCAHVFSWGGVRAGGRCLGSVASEGRGASECRSRGVVRERSEDGDRAVRRCRTLRLTDPSNRPRKPPRPRLPTTTSSAPAEASTSTSAGRPCVTRISTSTFGNVAAHRAIASEVIRSCSAASSATVPRAQSARPRSCTRWRSTRAARSGRGRVRTPARTHTRWLRLTGRSRRRRPRRDGSAMPGWRLPHDDHRA